MTVRQPVSIITRRAGGESFADKYENQLKERIENSGSLTIAEQRAHISLEIARQLNSIRTLLWWLGVILPLIAVGVWLLVSAVAGCQAYEGADAIDPAHGRSARPGWLRQRRQQLGN